MSNADMDLSAPGDPNLAPGEARCPGGTVAETLAADGDATPAPLLAQSYEFLGDADIPFARYTDPAFYEQEIRTVWRRTWQWACREEHLPNTGDYMVYDVGPYSVLVVRNADGAIRAFANSCPHRGMQFVPAGSAGRAKQFWRCPFHGMSWHLDGSLRDIPCRWDFPHIDENTFTLTDVQCATWGGFVFINLDPEAPPLDDYLEVLPEHFAEAPLEDRFVAVHTRKVLPGNWKMCMEAFLEAYHVLATHPEGRGMSAWANTQYDVFGPHVSRFLQTLSSGDPQAAEPMDEQTLFERFGHQGQLPDGISARVRHAEILREQLGEQMDTDLSGVSASILLDSIEYHLFPNMCFFPGINIPLIYRFRPLTVDSCVHDIMMLQPVPRSGRPAPAEVIDLDIDDSYTTVPELGRLGFVLDQDTENFKNQLAGMKAALKPGQTLGNYQEVRIRRFHMTLDNYLEEGA